MKEEQIRDIVYRTADKLIEELTAQQADVTVSLLAGKDKAPPKRNLVQEILNEKEAAKRAKEELEAKRVEAMALPCLLMYKLQHQTSEKLQKLIKSRSCVADPMLDLRNRVAVPMIHSKHKPDLEPGGYAELALYSHIDGDTALSIWAPSDLGLVRAGKLYVSFGSKYSDRRLTMTTEDSVRKLVEHLMRFEISTDAIEEALEECYEELGMSVV